MHIIEFQDYSVVPSPEIMLIKPFRRLWNADRSERKEKFLQQVSYCYFMVDPRSTYSYITDEDERAKEIIKQEGLPDDFKPSEMLQEAMDVYRKHCITTSSLLLEDTKSTIDKIRTELRDFNMSSLDDKDKANSLKTIASIVSMIPKMVKDLSEAEKTVTQELNASGRARGKAEKTLFDDGFGAF